MCAISACGHKFLSCCNLLLISAARRAATSGPCEMREELRLQSAGSHGSRQEEDAPGLAHRTAERLVASGNVTSISSECEGSCVCFHLAGLLPRRSSWGFGFQLPCKTEACWRVESVLLGFHHPAEMAEAAGLWAPVDLVCGRAARLHHAGLPLSGAS